MVGIEGELRAVPLLIAKAEEFLHDRAAVRPVHPLAVRLPAKLRCFGRRGQRLASAKKSFDIDAIVDLLARLSHVCLLLYLHPDNETRASVRRSMVIAKCLMR